MSGVLMESLDTTIYSTAGSIVSGSINSYEAFGITPKMLNTLPYGILDKIFHGMHNFDAHKLYQLMNPTDILGFNVGMDAWKRPINTVIEENVPLVVAGLTFGGYSMCTQLMHIAEAIRLFPKQPFRPGQTPDLQSRMRLAMRDEDFLKGVKDALVEPRKYSNVEDKERCSFVHPCYDGRNKRLLETRIREYFLNIEKRLRKSEQDSV